MSSLVKFTQKIVGAKEDGIYGPETAQKVNEFLEKNGLSHLPFGNTIVAIRTNDTYTDKFDDLMIVRTKSGKIVLSPCSTKAGRHYALNPLNPFGTAVIAEGSYHNSHKAEYTYRFGGRFIELKQIGNAIKYYRDTNRDNKIDRATLTSGFAGLNIHVAKSSNVGKWSAGCIVVPVEYWLELEKVVFEVGKYYSLTVLRKDIELPKPKKRRTSRKKTTSK